MAGARRSRPRTARYGVVERVRAGHTNSADRRPVRSISPIEPWRRLRLLLTVYRPEEATDTLKRLRGHLAAVFRILIFASESTPTA